ncbi:MAG: phosphatase PAP2 family protein [Bacteroidaceae bacterium]|nr:phosphatase PAP2 family protein [Bacteroidaceae bacterium]
MTEALQSLIETDRAATLAINGSDSIFIDGVASLYTELYVWAPLALMALYLIIRNITTRRILLVLLMIALTVIICDRISSGLFKPIFHRLRPTRDPMILNLVDTVNGYRGGLYGFFSGHAANSFGIAVFFIWLVRELWFGISVTVWASLNALIRCYLGAHFLGDVLVGAIFGTLAGTFIFFLYKIITRKDRKQYKYRDSLVLYTSTGFLRSDVYSFLCVLFGTYAVILSAACITAGL